MRQSRDRNRVLWIGHAVRPLRWAFRVRRYPSTGMRSRSKQPENKAIWRRRELSPEYSRNLRASTPIRRASSAGRTRGRTGPGAGGQRASPHSTPTQPASWRRGPTYSPACVRGLSRRSVRPRPTVNPPDVPQNRRNPRCGYAAGHRRPFRRREWDTGFFPACSPKRRPREQTRVSTQLASAERCGQRPRFGAVQAIPNRD